jgi:hypothetical protein
LDREDGEAGCQGRRLHDSVLAHSHRREPGNLPSGYIEKLERQYARNPAMRARMLMGEYADAFDGQPVLYNFTQEHAYEVLGWPKGAYLIRGWDFGTTNAVIWSAYFQIGQQEYWWDLLEYYAEQSDVERQCIRVREFTEMMFPFWNDREKCSGIKDFCDPAGAAKKDTGSSLKVLHTHGIFPAYARRGLPETIALYNRLLEAKDQHGTTSTESTKRIALVYTPHHAEVIDIQMQANTATAQTSPSKATQHKILTIWQTRLDTLRLVACACLKRRSKTRRGRLDAFFTD